jgi:hypothetical protein
VVEASFSADGAFAITASETDRVIVWDVKHAAAGETLEGHAGKITGLAISHDSQTLYTVALDGKVIIWDLAGARRLGRPFKLGPGDPGELPRYALSPDGRVLAAGHRDGTITLIDARTLKPLSTFRVVPKGPCRGVGYVPGGRPLVVGGERSSGSRTPAARRASARTLGGRSSVLDGIHAPWAHSPPISSRWAIATRRACFASRSAAPAPAGPAARAITSKRSLIADLVAVVASARCGGFLFGAGTDTIGSQNTTGSVLGCPQGEGGRISARAAPWTGRRRRGWCR